MALSGPELDQLQNALLSAFDEPSLREMVRSDLEQNLTDIAGGASRREIITRLVEWAENTGHTDSLVTAAVAWNPDSSELRAFVAQYMAGGRGDEPGRPQSENTAEVMGSLHDATTSPQHSRTASSGRSPLIPGDGFGGDNVMGDKTTVGNISHSTGVAIGPGATATVTIQQSYSEADLRDRDNRRLLRQLVSKYWIEGVLEHSLSHGATIRLVLSDQSGMVDNRPWRVVPLDSDQNARVIATDTAIVDIFDQMNQRMLILGEPGAGKTTLLLELAHELIKRADTTPTLPSPVVLNLSSWIQRKAPLAEWLVDELVIRYNIPKKIAQAWVDQDKLLLLLDGLDEVQPEHRNECVVAINQFQQEHLAPLVICSRLAEYKSLDTRLKLQGAVLVQPLTHEQVDSYLAQAGPSMAAVRTILQQDADLQEMARSPLMLSVMSLAYRDASPTTINLTAAGQTRRSHMFDTYIKEMLVRREAEPAYTPLQTVRWLQWLAVRLLRHGQAVFLIERIQPAWLDAKRQRLLYAVGVAILASLPIALLCGLGIGLPVVWSGTRTEGVLLGISTATAVALAIILLVRRVFGVVASGLVGLSLGIAFGWPFALIYGAYTGLAFGVLLGAAFGLAYLFTGRQISRRDGSDADEIVIIEKLGWSRSRTLFGAAIGFTCGLVAALALWWAIAGERFIPGFGLLFALAISAPAATIVGVFTGLTNTAIETKIVPNQGIHRSFQNAVRIGVLLLVAVGLPLGFMSGVAWQRALGWVPFYSELSLPVGIVVGLGLGSAIALTGSLIFGGLSCIQHWLLRFQMYYTRTLPWRLAGFLDESADHVLLQRVGGGYIFVHRLLMEHFASLSEDDIERITSDGSLRGEQAR